MAAEIQEATVWEGGSAVNLARVLDVNGDAVTKAGTTHILRRIFDKHQETGVDTRLVATDTLNKTTTLFDTLQTTDLNRWTKDTEGYNFADVVPTAKLPDGDRYYRVRYELQPTSGDPLIIPFGLHVRDILEA